MKAFVLEARGRAALLDRPLPAIGAGDALVRTTAMAVCTTDVHLIKTAAWPHAVGKIIGHESVGVVEKVGAAVKDFRPGDRVVLPSAGTDWHTPFAQRGEAKYYQHNNPYFSADPTVNGNFSEYMRAIDADMRLARIPAGVTDIQALMIPDMVATGFTGVERMEVAYGDTVLVLGIGPMGLMGVAAAALRGAARIIAVGSRPLTVELARKYGATDVVDYRQGEIGAQVMALTGGRPVDSALVASGGSASESITTAMRCVKFGGHVACVSLFFDEESVTIPLDVWCNGSMEKFLTGVLCQDGRDFFERLLALVEYGRLDPAPLVTHVLHGWEAIEMGLELMRSRDPGVIKPVVVID